jgi:hypothetical protein
MMIIKLVDGVQAVCANCTLAESMKKVEDDLMHYDQRGFYLVKLTHTEFVLCRECFQTMSDIWVFDFDCGNKRSKIGDYTVRMEPRNN